MNPSALLEDAENAIKTLQGQDLKGRKLKLESAVKKARGKNAAKEIISDEVENTDVIIPSAEILVEVQKETKVESSEKEGTDKKKKKLSKADNTAEKKEKTKKSEKINTSEVAPKSEKIEKAKKVTAVVEDEKKSVKLKTIKNAELASNVVPVVVTAAPSSSLKLLILGNKICFTVL